MFYASKDVENNAERSRVLQYLQDSIHFSPGIDLSTLVESARAQLLSLVEQVLSEVVYYKPIIFAFILQPTLPWIHMLRVLITSCVHPPTGVEYPL